MIFSNELDVMLDSSQKSQSHFAARLKQTLVDEWVEEESNTSSVHLQALNFQTRTKQALHGGSRYTVSILNWSRMYVVILLLLLLLLLLCAIMLCAIMYAMRRFNFAFSVSLFLAFFTFRNSTHSTHWQNLWSRNIVLYEEHDKIRKWEALLILQIILHPAKANLVSGFSW